MGTCFSKKSTTATAKSTTAFPTKVEVSPNPEQPTKTKNAAIVSTDQVPKKEIFFIKHRTSREIDRFSDQEYPNAFDSNKNPNTTNGESSSNQEADAIPIQRGRLSRSNSAGGENPKRRRRFSGSKTSFDFDFDSEAGLKKYDERRVCSSCSRRSSRDREERRVSISPNRRSESPCFRNSNNNGNINGGVVKMISVPATDKTNNVNGGVVKRIHVKRNVSPARNPLTDIDNNGGGNQKLNDMNVKHGGESVRRSRSSRLSRDLDMNPPSYASLLLEDIHNFHQNNTTTTRTTMTMPPVPAFSLPECVNKARLIMEAVADLNKATELGKFENNTSKLYE